MFVSYYIVPSYSPWAFATADSLSFEIHGDGVNARVRRPHRLQGPAKCNRGRRAEFRNNKKKRSTRTLGDTVLQRNTKKVSNWNKCNSTKERSLRRRAIHLRDTQTIFKASQSPRTHLLTPRSEDLSVGK